MADIPTTALTAVRRLDPPRLSFPKLAIGAWLNTMSGLMADALKMAYVDPYASIRRQPRAVPGDDLEGRDPSW
ncbi:MAG: hypothetical protein E5X49_14535 [Mesorhizobium sp.]|uniref:hypothetical protein n=1 Tax=Mesorhizobium sp. TaxID=1871066 RepID=UPI000FE5E90F|nr:hypothetical protein [Mesorhizobium sp.]RWK07915.1 MAG: hypothetical protein EOR39_21040 [Mesorhizobium sp.]TIQ42425.1 MAG: hypothetical protein E5X49_14535 [Mesorhizobium sp.]TIQ48319.1 MAG: hypothetical protein E5X47_18405 [Mesorhizobium sp.]TIQ57864.1 MAG: hypothetical protein E5X46_13740 [Mesorhizobium sp.]